MNEHQIVRIWQERPSTVEWCEISYRCSCGMVYKHQPMPIGEGHDVEYACANGGDEPFYSKDGISLYLGGAAPGGEQ